MKEMHFCVAFKRTTDEAGMLEYAFERYFRQRSLLGSVEDTAATVRTMKQYGVDEIACLLDFGLDRATVLGGLPLLNELRGSFKSLT